MGNPYPVSYLSIGVCVCAHALCCCFFISYTEGRLLIWTWLFSTSVEQASHSFHSCCFPLHCVWWSLWGFHGVFNWPPGDRHPDCSWPSAFINSAAMNHCVHLQQFPEACLGQRVNAFVPRLGIATWPFRGVYQCLFLPVSVPCVLPTVCWQTRISAHQIGGNNNILFHFKANRKN